MSFPNTIHLQRVFTAELIQNIVSMEFNISKDTLLGTRRLAQWTWPRHVAMSLAYQMTGLSTQELATLFNRDNHVSILYAVRRVNAETSTKDTPSRLRLREFERIRDLTKIALGKVCQENDWTTLAKLSRINSVLGDKKDTST